MKALEDHEKQLIKPTSEKESPTILKQKDIFEEFVNEIIDEIRKLSKQIVFNILICYFKGKKGSENFIGFKGPQEKYKNIQDSYTTLEKAKENQTKKKQI